MVEQPPQTDEEWLELLRASLRTAHDAVLQAAANRQVSPREDGDHADPAGGAAGHCRRRASRRWRRGGHAGAAKPGSPTAPQSGEFINETTFFTTPNYLDVVQFGIRRGRVHGIAALSDGLQLLALQMPDATPHKAFFTPFFTMVSENEDSWETQQHVQRFLRSDRIKQRVDDDVTLVVATIHRLVQHVVR